MKITAMYFVILAGTFWGTSAIFSNVMRPFGFSALHMTAMRAIVAAIVMAIYILIKEPSAFKVKPKQLFLYALGGIATFCSSLFYYESMSEGSVPVAVMLMYTAPILVVTYSVLFLGEKLTKLKTFSIVLMLVGCALVSGIIGGARSSVWGICSGILSAICYGSYSIITKIQMNKKCNPSSATLYCFITMSLIALVIADVPQILRIASDNPIEIYPLIIGIGICTEAAPYFLYASSLKYIPAGTASSLSIVEPVMATVFAAVFFEGMPDLITISGIVLVVISVFMLSRAETENNQIQGNHSNEKVIVTTNPSQ